MRRYFCFAFLTAVLGLAVSVRADLVSGVSVVVNDSVITFAEIEEAVAPRVETIARLYGNDQQRFEQEVQKLRDQQIEALVQRKLILHEFVSSGYTTNILEAVIDDEIKEKIQKQYYGDRTRLIKTLQAEGMTYEMYRRQEREDYIIRYMIYQNVNAPKKTLISPLKIESYYNEHRDKFKVDDQVKLRMIVIPQASDSPDGTAKKIANEILAKLDAGVPFAEMASVYSAGSQRAEGGDRGWIDRTIFKPELANVAFSLKKGEHSGVIELPEACYLMMVEDVRPTHIKPLTEVRTEIEQTLKTAENLRLREKWIDRLKSKSFVQYY